MESRFILAKTRINLDLENVAAYNVLYRGRSWASVTKMSKGEVVGTEILMKVCKTLHCDIGDIVEFIENDNTENND